MTVLEEAQQLVGGDRQSDYGPPAENMADIAAVASVLLAKKLKEPLNGHDVALFMAGLKLVREANKPKRDNLVDCAGYLLIAEACQ